MNNAYINFDNLNKSYGNILALEGISAPIPEKSIFGLIGPDGAGKSTLMKIVVGLLKPDRGRLHFQSPETRKPGGIGYMSQEFSMYPDLTVRENLLFFADLYNIKGSERESRYHRLLKFSRLEDFTDRRAENLSGGMKQKLALISLLMYAPPLLILDEPTTGVDPMARAELWEMLQQLKAEGRTILVSTPYMEEAVQCDRVVFLSGGQALTMNSPERLKHEYQYNLFEIRTTGIMTVLSRLEQESWIHLIYPKGDKLHLSVHDTTLTPSQVEDRISKLLPQKFEVNEIAPGMEDVFAALEEQA